MKIKMAATKDSFVVAAAVGRRRAEMAHGERRVGRGARHDATPERAGEDDNGGL